MIPSLHGLGGLFMGGRRLTAGAGVRDSEATRGKAQRRAAAKRARAARRRNRS